MGAPGKNPEQAHFIASKVDHLFRTVTRPNGKPYTYQQVAAGTGLNFSYIRKLRVGKVSSPSREVLQKLGAFFGVPPDYWFRPDLTVPLDAQEKHQLAMLCHTIEQAGFSPEQLQFIDRVVAALRDGRLDIADARLPGFRGLPSAVDTLNQP